MIDKRILQSKKLIIDALLVLMEQYEFKQITVLQICQEAQVSRNTFYRLFDTKEVALSEYLGNEIENIISQFEELEEFDFLQPPRLDIERTYKRFFSYWLERRGLLKILFERNLFGMFYIQFCEFVKNQMSNDIIRYYEERTNSTIGSYYYGWYGSAICGILESWIGRGFKETPEQLAEITIQLYQSMNYQFKE